MPAVTALVNLDSFCFSRSEVVWCAPVPNVILLSFGNGLELVMLLGMVAMLVDASPAVYYNFDCSPYGL